MVALADFRLDNRAVITGLQQSGKFFHASALLHIGLEQRRCHRIMERTESVLWNYIPCDSYAAFPVILDKRQRLSNADTGHFIILRR